MQAGIDQAKAQTSNTNAQEALTKIQTQIADIDLQIKNQTKIDEISIIQALRDTAIANIKIIENQADISTETKTSIINSAKLSLVETATRISAMKTGINLTQEQTRKVAQEVMAIPIGLSLEARKTRVQEIANKYATGEEAGSKRSSETIKNWVNMFTDTVEAFLPN